MSDSPTARNSRRRGALQRRSFTLAGKIDGFGQNFGGFLWSVEAHRVFGGDEIEPPLRLPLQFECGFELFLGDASLFSVSDGVELIRQGLAGTLQQLEVSILNRIYARLDFFFREVMAGLARAVDIQQWTAHPVVGNFCRPITLIWHVAFGTGDTGRCINPLSPYFECGMLRFKAFAKSCNILGLRPTAKLVVSKEIAHGSSSSMKRQFNHCRIH